MWPEISRSEERGLLLFLTSRLYDNGSVEGTLGTPRVKVFDGKLEAHAEVEARINFINAFRQNRDFSVLFRFVEAGSKDD